MKFEEVKSIVLGNSLGYDFIGGDDGKAFLIEDDGVLTGREQLSFLLSELKENYLPDVEMTQEESDIIHRYLDDNSFLNLLSSIDNTGGFKDARNFIHRLI